MYFEHEFHEQCSFYNINYENHRDNGLCSKLKFVCNRCDYYKWIDLIKDDDAVLPLNKSAVIGTIVAGTGFTELKQQLAAMNIPSMSSRTYRRDRETLVPSFENVSQKSMNKAGTMEREMALMENGTINGIPFITVEVDGSWLKRSYKSGKFDSLSGSAAIIGSRTKQVLYVGVRNKSCYICDAAESKKFSSKRA